MVPLSVVMGTKMTPVSDVVRSSLPFVMGTKYDTRVRATYLLLWVSKLVPTWVAFL